MHFSTYFTIYIEFNFERYYFFLYIGTFFKHSIIQELLFQVTGSGACFVNRYKSMSGICRKSFYHCQVYPFLRTVLFEKDLGRLYQVGYKISFCLMSFSILHISTSAHFHFMILGWVGVYTYYVRVEFGWNGHRGDKL